MIIDMPESEPKINPAEAEKSSGVFQVGDFVVFDREIPHLEPMGLGGNLVPAVMELVGKYGEGPFRVLLARDNFPELIKEGGHRQNLVIELPDGRKMPVASSWFKKQMP